MIYPVIPENNLIVIAIRQSRVVVCRFIEVQPYIFETEDAVNWQELETLARRVVENQIGAIIGDDIIPCPPELAERAEWS